MILNWGELITLEYGKPVKDKEATDGKVPVVALQKNKKQIENRTEK